MDDLAAPLPVLFGWLADVDGPRSWQDLDLDQLGYTPPRRRHMFQSGGQPWTDPDGLLVFANDAALNGWLKEARPP